MCFATSKLSDQGKDRSGILRLSCQPSKNRTGMLTKSPGETRPREKLLWILVVFRRGSGNNLFESNGELIGLNDRPSLTSFRGVATLYQGSIRLLHFRREECFHRLTDLPSNSHSLLGLLPVKGFQSPGYLASIVYRFRDTTSSMWSFKLMSPGILCIRSRKS